MHRPGVGTHREKEHLQSFHYLDYFFFYFYNHEKLLAGLKIQIADVMLQMTSKFRQFSILGSIS